MYSKELVYVTTIAESGSLSAAAKKLSMTQPALSIFLSNLEGGAVMEGFSKLVLV